MKATGIVRRIDDLGRVVIPKEIRRTMRIREGDPSLTGVPRMQITQLKIRDIAERIDNFYRVLLCVTENVQKMVVQGDVVCEASEISPLIS